MIEQSLPGLEAPEPDINRDNWQTPDWLFCSLDQVLHFVCDLAANERNHKTPHYLTERDDALSCEWLRSGWLWLNPPFSKLEEFAEKARTENIAGTRIVMLTPANRCEQDWWHRYVLGRADQIVFPKRRVEYVPPPGVKASGPAFPSVLSVYDYQRRGGVTEACSLDQFLRARAET